MAIRSLPRRKAKPSPITPDPEELLHIKNAADQLLEAIRSLRIAGAMFESDGVEHAEADDVRHVACFALGALNNAAEALFETSIAQCVEIQGVLMPLYDLIDVMTVLCFALAGGQYPPSSGQTTSPAGGTISAVRTALPGLHATLMKFIDRVKDRPRGPRPSKAARGQEARS